jgi:hypothetical protein
MDDTTTDTPVQAAPAQADQPFFYPPAYQSLMAVSLLGCIYGPQEDGDKAAAAVEQTLIDTAPYRLNRAMALGLGGQPKAAEAVLKSSDAEGHEDIAKVVLAVSKMLAGDADWQQLMQNVLASSADPVARQAATGVIGYLLTLKP